ncbi:hypothetical protein CR205_06055 [Alteribacter lacisalsi]|uniref:Uncharacterized protein n=1 Tax=Alteribacter lacisalsi TaxID=2045244 RepID=A0A2W0HAH4_9BACI|nr:hypothetical protein [Alteribacter lacisalsi]PYZ98157.1 hypothetical protein CR205_06055 [Alteribacter lacisalsi]
MARLTVEEERLSETYILYELARKVLESDLVRIQEAPVKLKTPYIHLLEQTIRLLGKELHFTKVQMKKLGLKVEFNSKDETFSEYTIFFRGYALTAKYMNAHLKNKVADTIEAGFFRQSDQSFRTGPAAEA